MFPINSNDAYIKENGMRSTIGKELSAGGGTSELPEYSESDAGKVLTVGDDGELEWQESGGAGGVYVGTTPPDASLGVEGDYYYERFIDGSVTTAGSFESTSNAAVYGNEYQVAYPCTITKIRVMASASKTGNVRIGNRTTILETIENVSFVADQWTEFELSTPISASAGDYIIVQAVMPASPGQIRFTAVKPTYNTKIADFVQSRYGTSYPGSTESDRYTAVDFVYELDAYLVDKQYIKTSTAWSQL